MWASYVAKAFINFFWFCAKLSRAELLTNSAFDKFKLGNNVCYGIESVRPIYNCAKWSVVQPYLVEKVPSYRALTVVHSAKVWMISQLLHNYGLHSCFTIIFWISSLYLMIAIVDNLPVFLLVLHYLNATDPKNDLKMTLSCVYVSLKHLMVKSSDKITMKFNLQHMCNYQLCFEHLDKCLN